MSSRSKHIPDRELLLFADCELSARKRAALCAHLSVCLSCEERLAKISSGLEKIATTYDRVRIEIPEIAGPRALLRARLAEEGRARRAENALWWRSILGVRTLAIFSLLILLTAVGFQILNRQRRQVSLVEAASLPDPSLTPGSIRQTNLEELCATDREEVVRSVPSPVEQQVFREYGIKRVAATDFEVDYLITPGLGGSDDPKNLWPEPHSNTMWNSYVKDQLEDRLHRMVCARTIPLEQAQREIARDWISAYKKYFKTAQPLASLSF